MTIKRFRSVAAATAAVAVFAIGSGSATAAPEGRHLNGTAQTGVREGRYFNGTALSGVREGRNIYTGASIKIKATSVPAR